MASFSSSSGSGSTGDADESEYTVPLIGLALAVVSCFDWTRSAHKRQLRLMVSILLAK